MICVIPSGRSARVSVSLQPFLFVKLPESRGRSVLVTVSVPVRDIDWKLMPPVFCSLRSTHQPIFVQLSMPLYEAVKLAPGVGVSVGVDVGRGVGLGGGV